MDSDVRMPTTIIRFEEARKDAWDEYVLRHPGSSVFHLIAWKRVIEKCFGFRERYLLATQSGAIRGVLPLFLVSNVLQGRSLISTPFAVYGGPCADDLQLESALRDAARQLAGEERVQYLELREQQGILDPEFVTKELYVTFDMELPKTSDELQRSFPRDTRYMIRKAQKNGLQAKIDNRDIGIFYEIYSRSFHHLGTPVFSQRLFEAIMEEFGAQCELTTIWRDTTPLSAVLSFRFKDWILPYFGGSLLEGRKFAANNFMYWEVMTRAIERGIRYFDFGRSKLGSGSYAFKAQWSMRERRLPYQFALVRRTSLPNFSPANPKFKLAISVWKSLPFGLTKLLGPAVVQLFP